MEGTTETRRTSEEAVARSMLMDPEGSRKTITPEAEMKAMTTEGEALPAEATGEATPHPSP